MFFFVNLLFFSAQSWFAAAKFSPDICLVLNMENYIGLAM